jgi:DNA polymerase III alpha subunit
MVQNFSQWYCKVEKVNVDKYGQVILSESEAFRALYQGQTESLDSLCLDNADIVEKYNQSINKNADSLPEIKLHHLLDIPVEQFDQAHQCNWFMPEEYKKMDIEGFLVDQCPRQNHERLVEELVLFRQHNMLDLLRYLKYLVDTMRSKNILWGVGRGSSVASYCLYLLGVHKIDSVKYNLDINEFLK